jgi:DNA polymerase-3 subunit alpha (Gram-positive type)
MDVPMNAPEVYELFTSVKPLGLNKGDIDTDIGTYALPEFGTRFSQKMLEEAQPKCFADLLQISGLSHGTDVWTGNAQDLIRDGTCTISNVIGCRDNIMIDLIRYGLDNAEAFKIMESVRKGKGLTPEWEEHMIEHGVPDWYIGSCKKIKYMFPKAHAAAYVMSAIRLGWFKIHRPLEFYAAFFSVAPGGFDGQVVAGGKESVKALMREIDEKIRKKEDNQKDKETLSTMQLVLESMARGIKYLPVHLYKSDASKFLPEDGKIRMPFNCLPGLGDTAAEKIVQARQDGEFFSKQELQDRAKATKAVIEMLEKNHVLDGLSETNQITLF